jgi:hypothetical protein
MKRAATTVVLRSFFACGVEVGGFIVVGECSVWLPNMFTTNSS